MSNRGWRWLTLELDVLANLVSHITIETLVDNHLFADILPRHLKRPTTHESAPWLRSHRPDRAQWTHLVEFVDGRRDGPNLVRRHSADGKEAVEDLAVVDLQRITSNRGGVSGRDRRLGGRVGWRREHTLTVKSLIDSLVSTWHRMASTSASGTIGSYVPAMSKSCPDWSQGQPVGILGGCEARRRWRL